jgi:hypothetical protein
VVNERTRSPTRGLLLKAHGQSRFEYEVAALITAASGLQVEKDVRIDVPGQARALRVDLWLPEIRRPAGITHPLAPYAISARVSCSPKLGTE